MNLNDMIAIDIPVVQQKSAKKEENRREELTMM